MKKLLTLLIILFPAISYSQTFYTETFDGTTCGLPGGSGCDPTLVAWTVTNTGANGATANTWYVSDTESGMNPGDCGAGGMGNQTLHVGNVPGSACDLVCPNGDCGAAYDACTATEITDKRAESPFIDCTGQSNITLAFDYIEAGQTTLDDATLWYFDGTTWTQIDPLAKTPLTCNPQGTWTAFSILLPASANNNPNVKVGFRWVNNGDGTGSDPSFAVNDVTLTSSSTTNPPVASFTATSQNICEGDCIDFTNTSSNGPFTAVSWSFTGGIPSTSTAENPVGICYSTAGTYAVSLTVTNADGSDTETQTGYITVTNCSTPPVASFTTANQNICVNDCIDFTNTSTGAPFTAFSWSFTGGIPATSTDENPTNICYSVAGTYAVSLTVTNADGSDTETQAGYITVTNCSTPPVASFTTANQNICINDCIDFTNTSTGAPFTAFSWSFTGGTPSTSTDENPTNICYSAAGTYAVSLTVTNADGSDTETQAGYITVTSCSSPPVASFTASSQTVCVGETVIFTDNSTNTPTSWSWTFAGGTPNSSTLQNPTVVYNSAGTYSVSLTASNAAGSNTNTQINYITVVNCPPPTASFSLSENAICAGECITITDNSTDATSYVWIFNGGNPSGSTAANPGTVCYPSPGTYDIELIVTNASGSDTTSATVTVSTTPSVTATGDTTVDLGNSVPIEANGSGSGTYLWTPSAGVVCTTCASTDVNPQETGYYVVTYTENGCSVSDSVLITVNIIQAFGVPNAFSPNGDGNNDELFVYGQGIFRMTFKVYNRYGQLVFETSDQATGWDGTHGGKECNTGVFAWMLEYTLADGTNGSAAGNVTLVR